MSSDWMKSRWVLGLAARHRSPVGQPLRRAKGFLHRSTGSPEQSLNQPLPPSPPSQQRRRKRRLKQPEFPAPGSQPDRPEPHLHQPCRRSTGLRYPAATAATVRPRQRRLLPVEQHAPVASSLISSCGAGTLARAAPDRLSRIRPAHDAPSAFPGGGCPSSRPRVHRRTCTIKKAREQARAYFLQPQNSQQPSKKLLLTADG